MLLSFGVLCTSAQDRNVGSDNKTKRETKTKVNRGNPGDPTNSRVGEQQDPQGSSDNEGDTPSQSQDRESPELIGSDNKEAEGTSSNEGNTSSDYRNNRVSGNPNNRSVDGGSDNQTARTANTDESSAADGDSTAMNMGGGQSVADPDASNVPAVVQENTSQSGSPAMRAESKDGDRDGTNNVQRAKPNMAGSPVKGMRYSGKAKDTDREIKKGTMRQQSQTDNDVSKARNKNQRGQQQSQMKSGNPHPNNQGSLPGSSEQTNDGTPADQEQPQLSQDASTSSEMGSQKENKKDKKKKKKKRNRD